MKCQNCGKNEVNFHYSSNVNGCVTETHLCHECAARSGYDLGSMFETKSIFDGFFPFGMSHAFMPLQLPGFVSAFPYSSAPRPVLKQKECDCGGGCEMPEQESHATEIDGEMQKRREVNVIREKMRIAAEKEDFEKAAELRDQIRKMEADEG